MIVRTYGRRSRSIGRSFSDTTLLDDGGATVDGGLEDAVFSEPLLSQDNPHDLYGLSAFSSQDSSSWSLDSDLFPSIQEPAGNSSNGLRKPSKKERNLKRARSGEAKNAKRALAISSTATLMETQEFGEMMEHVDEVNFALDGLRLGQPARIRRASLLSLLTICQNAQQRQLLRAQGMARRIVDAILGLSFDDSSSTVAAAALFFVLASDVQDDHLLDSPSCIHFLLKLLNPPMADAVEDKAPTFGCKLLGISKPRIPSISIKELDRTSTAIYSKVQEILLSCKEMRLGKGDDEGMGRPELSSKWIALLTMEKACLSTVSFEDTSDVVRRVRGDFKERLRELGGLDAIFDVASKCHSMMEGWSKHTPSSVLELKDGVVLQNVLLLLKCLKIMENATFLSKDNQSHLLGMKAKFDSKGLPVSFAGVIISAIKTFSGLSLLQSSSRISSNGKSKCFSDRVDDHFCHAPEALLKENHEDDQDGSSYCDSAGCSGTEKASHVNIIEVCKKRQRLSGSQPEASLSGSQTSLTSAPDVYSIDWRADCPAPVSCNGALSGSNGSSSINGNGSKMNSVGGSKGWISIKASCSRMNCSGLSKRSHMSEPVKGECMKDSYDPFAFDDGDVEPSKWELLAIKKETSQTQSTATEKELEEGCDFSHIRSNCEITNEENHHSFENSCPPVIEEDSNLLQDCLLTAIKVLMNLTNDNPVGCQQIAACGGLDTMASLIISHFPSFDLCLSAHSQLDDNVSFSNPNIRAGHLNNKHLSDYELEFLVAILGLLVNLVEKDNRNRSRLASARVSVARPGKSGGRENHRDVIPLLCSIFLANQGAGEAAGENEESSFLQGEREAEMMIIEAYAALLLAFLSTESSKAREAIASWLPNHNLEVLVPVLERFVAFHLTLNMISPETHSAVSEVIESCKGP